tara:strand:+ start:474 stop:677 length:204 start_codon:yes stop_codon:yes gene_type:complete
MVILLTIIAMIFTFYAPLYLRKRSEKIKPTKNMFEEFVENDHGYPWSTDEERISSYHKALEEKINSA